MFGSSCWLFIWEFLVLLFYVLCYLGIDVCLFFEFISVTIVMLLGFILMMVPEDRYYCCGP